MKVLIIGATGLIGRRLSHKLLERGHELFIFTRDISRAKSLLHADAHFVQWKSDEYIVMQEYAHKVDAVINLAGENLAAKRWTDTQKRKILASRVNIGKAISQALERSKEKPYLLIQASAVAYYGFSDNFTFIHDQYSICCFFCTGNIMGDND